jgi:hypothetical protein
MADTKEFASDVLDYLGNFSERVTSAVRTIDTEHSYIHSGIMFSTYKSISMTAGGTSKVQLTTPSSKYIHWRPSNIATRGDNVTVTLYEDSSTATAGGTMTAYNRDRVSSITSQMTILSSATVTTNGTAIDAAYIGGGTGTGGNRSGSETGEKNEMIFKQETNYTVEVVNGSTAANTVFLKLQWYEEADA